MRLPFFSVGHSNRPLAELVGLLEAAGVRRVADIRKFPMSRTNPQFNKDALSESLAASGISYEHVVSLGGRRGKGRVVPREVNAFWMNESFHNYADYALTEDFRAGLEHLRELGSEQRCAMMCSEAVWWRCHRRIVTDYLLAGGETVFHIIGLGRLDEASLTPGAVIQSDGTVVYPIG